MLLDGRYRVTERIARGGMATVYRAQDERLDRVVAVKVLHLHLAEDASFRNRFTHEALAAARLSHPNVVNVYDQGQQAGVCYLVLEYVPGQTLRHLLHQQGRLTPQVALEVLAQVLEGLAAAHQAGLMHRDLKPENILISPDGRVKIADFGLARAVESSTSATSALIGTVAYLSPELLRRGTADERSDIYALGIMLFEMLTGEQPFTGSAPAQVAFQHANDEVPLPSSIVHTLPSELDDLVVWATRTDPQDRPANATDLFEETRRVQSELDLPVGSYRALRALLGHAAAGDRSLNATEVLRPTMVAPAVPLTPPSPASAVARLPTVAPPLPVTGADGFDAGDGRDADTTSTEDPDAPVGDAVAPDERPSVESSDSTAATDRDRRPDDRDSAGDAVDAVLTRVHTRRRRGWSITAVVVAVTVLLAAAGWFLGDGPGARLTVPDVAGATLADAQRVLADAGIDSTSAEANSLDVPAGQVIGTDPSAGTRVPKDASISVVVSLGPRMIALPDVVGSKADLADDALAQAGFVVSEDRAEQFDDRVDSGSVIGVTGSDGNTVKAATELAERTQLGLVVSLGAVPSVSGQSLADATTHLQDVGLNVSSSEAFHDTVPAGSVISATPDQKPVRRGDTIRLVVSKGPEMVTVPDVSGQTLNDARATLRAAGLNGSSNFPEQAIPLSTRSYWDVVTVSGTDPAAGTSVRKGSTVTMKGSLFDAF
ncbi:PASTA domain-containing protein [Pseudoclavibacter sp. 13-3]|nr:PASTA domain-containing protein [Pseudoclavibacter sp. 13-3]MCD7102060.1 PASTA domain-containing protein [Pseudoclavibacter sp. 13-3]